MNAYEHLGYSGPSCTTTTAGPGTPVRGTPGAMNRSHGGVHDSEAAEVQIHLRATA